VQAKPIEQLENLLARESSNEMFWPDFSILSFISILLACLIFFIFVLRKVLQSLPGLASEVCPACEGTLKRIHQLWWLKAIVPLLPLRTMYCSTCGVKTIRVKQPVKKYKKRRSSAGEAQKRKALSQEDHVL
jgi:hypothetical protein